MHDLITVHGQDFLMLGVARDLNLPSDFEPDEIRISPPGAAEVLSGNGRMRYIRANTMEPVTVTARSGDRVIERTFTVRDLPITFRGELLYGYPPHHRGGALMFIGDDTTPNPVIEAAGRYHIDPPFNLQATSSAPGVLELKFGDGCLRRVIARAPGESLLRMTCHGGSAEILVRVVERPEIEWF